MQYFLGLPKLLDVRICSKGAGGWGRGKEGRARMEAIIGNERGNSGGRMPGIVIREFCQREEAGPVGLLVVCIDAVRGDEWNKTHLAIGVSIFTKEEMGWGR